MTFRIVRHLLAGTLAAVLSGCGDTETVAPAMALAGPLASVQQQLAAPSEVGVSTGSDGTVTLTWRDNSSNESRFEVLRANDAGTDVFFLLATVAANVTSYRDAGVGASSAYCYRVRAVRVKGQTTTVSAPSASACMPPALVAPSNVSVAATTETSIELAWQDNTTEETRFEVFARPVRTSPARWWGAPRRT